ncbi:MAG: hypothetical protein OXG81_08150 [Acidobacteria bacterium]|nr:hypothetical protein [Acidobacteriota bacterium]MCY3965691.1 hypothetical protein [Acidobacteriota bacterium]
MKRWMTIAACSAVAAVALGWGGFKTYRFMLESGLIRFNEYDIRTEGILQVGEPAPDLPLALVDGGEARLSDLWATKPLVLVFGSYT